MIPGSYDIPLHDIKPLMEVSDNSFVLLSVIIIIATLLFSGGLYLLYRFVRSRQTLNLRKIHYTALENIDFSDPKKAAYAITDHGRVFADDSERLHEAYDNLVVRLNRYKYRKRVEAIDEESKSYYNIYLGMIDV
ncbi:hypothetical protein [Sulfurimonas sp. HSL3-7]|uniref:hypothetical protein n=1 Tax=Sulfonitrofixus jiaomeiensis TaxID=3131938 RepID=UPI0031F826FC